MSIEVVPSSHPHVYDLTVAETRNMVTSSGLGVRDTFHNAGVAAKNVTLGVPRMEEIMNASKNIRTPLTQVSVKPSEDNQRYLVGATLKEVRLGELIESHSIEHDEHRVLHSTELKWYRAFPDPGTQTTRSEWVWSCILSRKLCVQNNVKIYSVIDALRAKIKKYAEVEYGKFYLQVRWKKKTSPAAIRKFVRQVALDLHVSGIKGIASCALDDESNDVIACGSSSWIYSKTKMCNSGILSLMMCMTPTTRLALKRRESYSFENYKKYCPLTDRILPTVISS